MLPPFSKNIAVVLMSFHHWKNEAALPFRLPELAHAARGGLFERIGGLRGRVGL
jgi:hypothetical protein